MSEQGTGGGAGSTVAPAPVEITKTTLEVPVRGETYEFKIPSLHEEIAIGSRVTKLRRDIDPLWDGFSMGLDGNTAYMLRACATFELLLKRASAQWVWSHEPNTGGPIVDSSKFPPDKVDLVMEVYQGFLEALSRFRQGGAKN